MHVQITEIRVAIRIGRLSRHNGSRRRGCGRLLLTRRLLLAAANKQHRGAAEQECSQHVSLPGVCNDELEA
jgi:hypothetical protein